MSRNYISSPPKRLVACSGTALLYFTSMKHHPRPALQATDTGYPFRTCVFTISHGTGGVTPQTLQTAFLSTAMLTALLHKPLL
jgi:hypothetical protein